MPQLDTTYYLSSIFWFLLCFGVLFLFSKFWLIPRLSKLVSERESIVSDKLKEIALLRQELIDLDATYQFQLQAAKAEAKRSQEEALKRFNEEAQHLLHKICLNCESFVANEEIKLQKEYDSFLQDKDKVIEELLQVFVCFFKSKAPQPQAHYD